MNDARSIVGHFMKSKDKPSPVDPTLHTILWRGKDARRSITLDEWREAAAGFRAFHITDKLKQQNPFTNEYVFFEIPGSGYWRCSTLEGPVWSGDDVVWFRFSCGAAVFIQFSDSHDVELQQLATLLHARVEPHRIGQ